MKTRIFLAFLFVVFSTLGTNAQEKKFMVHTVAFYNTENFYDTINDPNTRDDEWVYKSKYYHEKIHNIARVLTQIGDGENKNSPTIIGLSEIEHKSVLEDLVKDPQLIDKDYGVIEFESPDKRGIDVGLIYQKKHFKPTSYINIPLYIYEKDTKADKKAVKDVAEDADDKVEVGATDKRIYTRDQLLVTGLLDGEEFHFIVNHWPSRRGGEKVSSLLREKAAALNLRIIDSLQKINPNAKIISMGDLNDGPLNNSLKKVLNAKANKKEVPLLGIYNPSEKMFRKGDSTLYYRDAGDIFDQLIMTEPLVREEYSSFRYWKAGITSKPFMITTLGQYKGYPLRNSSTFVGYSDHLPAYIYLIKEVK
ncbi:endonuclease/exonuclease/phosphatase family protein [Flavobacterium sp. GT3R68]|uniref:endonuclease/exonuclease/phosphatase family protein n=1 Tax=Flavobacterium sp. GT3R68 TaxID=2594437 RepID=UPI000F8826D3|nr:endonuclease/exonuclease/phosphatase family protein [Flavobacterium sp. GT3R68]RTY95837.1 endonuclease/exonuclease/phosphatase family protein [Flavobacterium sp. GSN2]TRW93609.1 endonuclease/exonuclease/phosphatase family protein [Flavobacterium sp. GT3R68]